jgi:hypothetical protein
MRGRSLARRFRGSVRATLCVAPPERTGRARVSGSALAGSGALKNAKRNIAVRVAGFRAVANLSPGRSAKITNCRSCSFGGLVGRLPSAHRRNELRISAE